MRRRGGFLHVVILLAACVFAICLVQVVWLKDPEPDYAALRPCALTGLVLGCAHLILRPLMRTLAAPLGCLAPGLIGIAIDVGLVYLCANLVSGFSVPDPLFALVTAVIINIMALVTLGRK